MTEQHPFPAYLLETGALARRKSTPFDLRPEGAELSALMETLDLSALRKVVFKGTLSPVGRHDWSLEAHLGATAVQPCAITLEPVTTRIDIPVARRYVAEMPAPDAGTEEEDEFGGTAMLEDDTLEPLGRTIDLWAAMSEALALALPDYPRADGAELGSVVYTEGGTEALRDEDLKPFAGLAALKDKLESKE